MAPRSADLPGVGTVSIRPPTDDHPAPRSSSVWDDWGDLDPAADVVSHEHWVVDVTDASGATVAVGSLSAHPVWHGPTTGSRALNIGISLMEEHRGRGVGSVAQRLLAEELHDRGVVRVEASTDVANVAEQRALERAGFRCEGILRGAQVRRDGRHDLQLWSHLPGDA